MKIAYITAGAAGMYCGSCLHDNTLAKALIDSGEDVALIPTYTPIRTDEIDVSIDRVFYGAINVFLEQKSSFFRHTPRFIDKWLDARPLLNWVSGRGSSVDARELGELTLSVLLGENGHQRKELQKLIEFLAQDYRPDIVHLTNSMFLGFASEIRRQLQVPVVCSVQGEEIFLEELPEPQRSNVRKALRQRTGDVDGFVATSAYYVEFMSDYLGVARERLHQVNLGINLDGFSRVERTGSDDSFVMGFLARICPEKGAHHAVEAFHKLSEQAPAGSVRMRLAGYCGSRDHDYRDALLADVRRWGLADQFDHVGEVDRSEKIAFLAGLDVMTLPTVYREPKGLSAIESLAAGTPIVVPDHGAFPELVQETGGGLLYKAGDMDDLIGTLDALRQDSERRRLLGRKGQAVVHDQRDAAGMADATMQVYRQILAGGFAMEVGGEVEGDVGDV